jgi:type VI secretion system protein ImpA
MDASSPYTVDVDSLLAPVPGPLAGGVSVRYDTVYATIRRAREEEDPSLPMGDWERPLKKADWPLVESTCVEVLRAQSKDFQVAAWLCEAWTHLGQIEGVIAGGALMAGLAERYWADGHPALEDGDHDARAAPFVWMNENLPRTLLLGVRLLDVPERSPSAVTLNVWEQAVVAEPPRPAPAQAGQPVMDKPLTRDDVVAAAGRKLRELAATRDQLQRAAAWWEALSRLLDERMGRDAPSLARLLDMLSRLERAVQSMMGGRDPGLPAPAAQPAAEPASFDPATRSPLMDSPSPTVLSDATEIEAVMRGGAIQNRDAAYRLLETVAAYLQRTEPHSPTPYLIKRAVAWGRMSLPDLMQEVVREEGDIPRFFSLLGIKDSRE